MSAIQNHQASSFYQEQQFDDPSIPSCCARDEELTKKRVETESILRLNDRVALLEKRHKVNLLPNLDLCRCCHTVEDGFLGDYPALKEYRKDQMMIEDSPSNEKDEYSTTRTNLNDDATTYAVGGVSVSGDDESYSSDSDDDSEFDYLLEEQTVNITTVEETRKLELKLRAMQLKSAHSHGFGVHRPMHYSKIFSVGAGIGSSATAPEAVVIHLYDPYSISCAKLDIILEGTKFAQIYLGTKFLRADGKAAVNYFGSSPASFIVTEENIPCLIAIKNGNVVNCSWNLNGIIDRDSNVDEWALEEWLDKTNVLIRDMPSIEEICRIRPEAEALFLDSIDFCQDVVEAEDFYDCGLDGCGKRYPHKHIGSHDGLVISEANIKCN